MLQLLGDVVSLWCRRLACRNGRLEACITTCHSETEVLPCGLRTRPFDFAQGYGVARKSQYLCNLFLCDLCDFPCHGVAYSPRR